MDNIKKCASAFVFNNDKILLIYHKKFGLYLQPGGHIEGMEKPYEAAIREVYEETGINIIIENIKPFKIEVYNTKIGLQEDYQFVGIPINTNIKANDESFICDWFDINKLDSIPVASDIIEKVNYLIGR